MTHYDKLIDSIVEEMYFHWSENTSKWNEEGAKDTICEYRNANSFLLSSCNDAD